MAHRILLPLRYRFQEFRRSCVIFYRPGINRNTVVNMSSKRIVESKDDGSPSSSPTSTSDVNNDNEYDEVQAAQKKSTTSSKSASSDSSSSTMPKRYVTRGKLLATQEKNVQEAKDEIFSLDIQEKRKLYSCKNKYTELNNITTWPEHFSNQLADDPAMQRWWKTHEKEVVSDVNPDLNEKISLFRGDITTLEIDAIVNAANETLRGGGGVDGAIHRSAGIRLLKECELLNGCATGDAKITCGYKLPAKRMRTISAAARLLDLLVYKLTTKNISKYVIHTVGPQGEHSECLQSCYKNCLDLMRDNELTSVAFPCISTGIFGYPNLNAAKVALKTIRHWLDTDDYAQKVERIIFCLFLEKDVDIYNEQMQIFFPLERELPKPKHK